MGVTETITKVLQNAEKLKSNGAGNEANTKALLIEPMLASLGWDPVDLDHVEREVKVFEGTFLDYALKLPGAQRLYVEAKGVSENLDDKKFIAQTINYANNDGVLWCVLTNGVRWRVYKTNEPAAMDRKLLFEVDLKDDAETPSGPGQSPAFDLARGRREGRPRPLRRPRLHRRPCTQGTRRTQCRPAGFAA